jgi:excisionase family DNA binding protein
VPSWPAGFLKLNKNILMKQSLLMEIRQIKLLLGLKKQVLTLDEFCAYAGISKNYAYQLTASGRITFYRPSGKRIYFKLDDVIEFLTSNENKSEHTQLKKINNYFTTGKI